MPSKPQKSHKLDLLHHYADLRTMMREMEVTLGVDDLSPKELDVLGAVVQLHKGKGFDEWPSTREIRRHPACVEISQPTFYRILQQLGARGLINKVDDPEEHQTPGNSFSIKL